jgi:hypothetical protein
MTDLNSMYAQHLIETRIRQHPSGPAYHHHGITHSPETVTFGALVRSLVVRLHQVRSAFASRLQEQVDTPVGTPLTTAFLANIKDCVA